jgi:hypothetical protein
MLTSNNNQQVELILLGNFYSHNLSNKRLLFNYLAKLLIIYHPMHCYLSNLSHHLCAIKIILQL